MRTLTLKYCFIIAIATTLLTYTYNRCLLLKNDSHKIISSAIDIEKLEENIAGSQSSEYNKDRIEYNALMLD